MFPQKLLNLFYSASYVHYCAHCTMHSQLCKAHNRTHAHRERQSVKEKVREDGKAAQCSTSGWTTIFYLFVSVCQCAHSYTLTCVCLSVCTFAVRLRFRFKRRTWHIALPLDRWLPLFLLSSSTFGPSGKCTACPQRANNI